MKLCALLTVIFAGSTTASFAGQYDTAMQRYLDLVIANWASDPIIVTAIAERNMISAAYDQGQIDSMDVEWQAQVGTANAPLVAQVLTHPAADFLRHQVASSAGAITEVIVMDARGLNVAASAATSDMWQGDEAKYQETYLIGPNATHISEIQFDESTQTYQGQVSISVTDPATGAAIGAVTVGINAEALP